jgi:hypothetical protein
MRASIVRRRLATLAAAALLAAACEESPWSPENPFATFATDADRYTPGATVEVTIRNVSDETIGGGTCPWHLQRSAGDGWVTVAEGLVCPLAIFMLAPDQTTQATVVIPGNAPQGIYRILFPGIRPTTEDSVPAELQSTDQFEVATLQPL